MKHFLYARHCGRPRDVVTALSSTQCGRRQADKKGEGSLVAAQAWRAEKELPALKGRPWLYFCLSHIWITMESNRFFKAERSSHKVFVLSHVLKSSN